MNELAIQALSKARQSKGYTQEQVAGMVAERLGQSYSLRQYQKLEEGSFPKYKTQIIRAIDGILGTQLYELIYEQKRDEQVRLAISRDSFYEFILKEMAAMKAAIKVLSLEVIEMKSKGVGDSASLTKITLDMEAAMKRHAEQVLNEWKGELS